MTVLIAWSEWSLGDNTHNKENNVKCYRVYEFLINCILHLVWFHFCFTTKESVLRNDTRTQFYYHICIGFSSFIVPFIFCIHSFLPTIYKPCQAACVQLHQSVQRSEGAIATCKVRTLDYGKGGILITACIIPPLLWIGWLVGLDLFNDDTRPSGHISRPTQVDVSQSCFHSLNNYSSPIILSSTGG